MKDTQLQRGETASRGAHNAELPVQLRPLLPDSVAEKCASEAARPITPDARPPVQSGDNNARAGRPRISEFLRKRIPWRAITGGSA